MRISKKPVDPPKSIPSGEAKRFTYSVQTERPQPGKGRKQIDY